MSLPKPLLIETPNIPFTGAYAYRHTRREGQWICNLIICKVRPTWKQSNRPTVSSSLLAS